VIDLVFVLIRRLSATLPPPSIIILAADRQKEPSFLSALIAAIERDEFVTIYLTCRMFDE
jgi:hypothetical protein